MLADDGYKYFSPDDGLYGANKYGECRGDCENNFDVHCMHVEELLVEIQVASIVLFGDNYFTEVTFVV